MCCSIKEDRKAQDAVGFPSGWRFIFEKPYKKNVPRLEIDPSLHGLVILSPSGRRYRAVKRAINANRGVLRQFESLTLDFYTHIGATYSDEDADRGLVGAAHYLVGESIRQEWTDVEGRNKVVYGTVTGCGVDDLHGEDVVATVGYSEESRLAASSSIPEARKIPVALAVGGHESYVKQLNPYCETESRQPCWTWFTPEWRREVLCEAGCGVRLPRLTLGFRGFHLTFTVKESSIPGAGYGVFVKATPLAKTNSFELKAGEFLDLGVYAPFRTEDRKKECVHFVKNYIHSFKCEEFCFNTDDKKFDFDITDDMTGEPHELARRHIPSYVNECKAAEIPTVQAQFDPEGKLHYLLGVIDGEKLSLPADGTEEELFVYYGPLYESVRLRKGYSELPDETKALKIEELKKDDAQYRNDIASFDLEEVDACVDFLHGLFKKDDLSEVLAAAEWFGVKAGMRALEVSKVLKERVTASQQSGEQPSLELVQSVESLVAMLGRLFGRELQLLNQGVSIRV